MSLTEAKEGAASLINVQPTVTEALYKLYSNAVLFVLHQ